MSELADRLEQEQRTIGHRWASVLDKPDQTRGNELGRSGILAAAPSDVKTLLRVLDEAIAALRDAESEFDTSIIWLVEDRANLRRVIEQMEDVMQDGRLTIKMSLSHAYLHEYDAALAAAEEALK